MKKKKKDWHSQSFAASQITFAHLQPALLLKMQVTFTQHCACPVILPSLKSKLWGLLETSKTFLILKLSDIKGVCKGAGSPSPTVSGELSAGLAPIANHSIYCLLVMCSAEVHFSFCQLDIIYINVM